MLLSAPKTTGFYRAAIVLVCVCLLLSGCRGTRFTLDDGQSLRWADLRGQWVFINYWAVWCKPCIEEIPQLNDVHEMQLGYVLGVNFDQPEQSVLQQQRRKLAIKFPVLQSDPVATLGYERPKVLPTTVIFDPEGRYRGVLLGPQTAASLKAAQLAYGLE